MKLTLIETSYNADKFLSIWINGRLFRSDDNPCVYDWTKGFECGLEYSKVTYEKEFLSFTAETEDSYYASCGVQRSTPLDDYVAELSNLGLTKAEEE